MANAKLAHGDRRRLPFDQTVVEALDAGAGPGEGASAGHASG